MNITSMTRACVLILSLSMGLVTGCSSERDVGGACRVDADCDGRCLDDYPGGMCTYSCRGDEDCPGDTVCADTKGGVCLIQCDSNAFCRDQLGPGYECADEDTFDDRKVLICKKD